MIYVCEDDLPMAQDLCGVLRRYGYEAEYARDFGHVVEEILRLNPELVLLDINLPQFDGFSILRSLRKTSELPVIMVTSRESEMDELMSMNLGADDYITKPCNMQILLAHITSVLRRGRGGVTETRLEYKGVTLDLSAGMLAFAGRQTELTKNEQRILDTLLRSSGQIVSRAQLMDVLWQNDEFVDDNTLTVNINRLRKKLEGIGLTGFLLTRRGQGYMV